MTTVETVARDLRKQWRGVEGVVDNRQLQRGGGPQFSRAIGWGKGGKEGGCTAWSREIKFDFHVLGSCARVAIPSNLLAEGVEIILWFFPPRFILLKEHCEGEIFLGSISFKMVQKDVVFLLNFFGIFVTAVEKQLRTNYLINSSGLVKFTVSPDMIFRGLFTSVPTLFFM
jgi:hypothetical protein